MYVFKKRRAQNRLISALQGPLSLWVEPSAVKAPLLGLHVSQSVRVCNCYAWIWGFLFSRWSLLCWKSVIFISTPALRQQEVWPMLVLHSDVLPPTCPTICIRTLTWELYLRSYSQTRWPGTHRSFLSVRTLLCWDCVCVCVFDEQVPNSVSGPPGATFQWSIKFSCCDGIREEGRRPPWAGAPAAAAEPRAHPDPHMPASPG